jgi:hypothetical protein
MCGGLIPARNLIFITNIYRLHHGSTIQTLPVSSPRPKPSKKLGLALIPQLLGLGFCSIGFASPSEGFENNAFSIPGQGVVGIKPDRFVTGLDGLVVLALLQVAANLFANFMINSSRRSKEKGFGTNKKRNQGQGCERCRQQG